MMSSNKVLVSRKLNSKDFISNQANISFSSLLNREFAGSQSFLTGKPKTSTWTYLTKQNLLPKSPSKESPSKEEQRAVLKRVKSAHRELIA